MKWRLPIFSLYLTFLSLIGVGSTDIYAVSNITFRTTRIENSHRHTSQIHALVNGIIDNTEDDDHQSFVGPVLVFSFIFSPNAFYTDAFQSNVENGNPTITKRFILFRSILI